LENRRADDDYVMDWMCTIYDEGPLCVEMKKVERESPLKK
jgi:hypothetical protein